MAEVTHGMKLAITSEAEIMSLMHFLNDCISLKEDLGDKQPSEIDFKEYKILGRGFFFSKDDHEDLLCSVFVALDNIHFQRILWNCSVMLENCADLAQDTLDFSPDIKRGLELVGLEKNGQIVIKEA